MPTINSRFYIKSTESPILKASYEFIKKMLARISGIPNIQVNGTLDSNDINRELGRTTLDISQYPYFNLVPTQLEDNLESYNSFTLKKFGTDPMQGKDSYWYSFHLRPCKITFTSAFFTQDFVEAINFMSNWHFNAREGTFKLSTKEGFTVDIRVEIDPTISFPAKDFESGSPFKIESTFSLYTYTGDIYKSPTLQCLKKELKIIPSVEVENLEEIFGE